MTDIEPRAPQDHASWQRRLEAAAAHVDECEEALELARQSRDELVVEAVDEGITTTNAGRWTKRSQSWVMGVIAKGARESD